MTNGGMAQKKVEKKQKMTELVPSKKEMPPQEKTQIAQLQKQVKKLNQKLEDQLELLNWYRDYYGAPKEWSQEYFVFSMLLSGGERQQQILDLLSDVGKTLGKKEALFKKLEKAGIFNFTSKHDYMGLYWLNGPKWDAIIETASKLVDEKVKELEPKPITGKPPEATIGEQKGSVVLWKDRPPDLVVPPMGVELLMFPGFSELYIDSSCGPYPVNAKTLETCREWEAVEMGDVELKAKLKAQQDMLMDQVILMIPVVGSVYMLGLDIKEIKSKKELQKKADEIEKYVEENKDVMPPEELFMAEMIIQQYRDAAPNWKDYAWLGFDVAVLGLDAAFAAQILVRTSARWNGRDALKVLEGEGGVGKVTQVEKDLFGQAAVELGGKAEDLYNVAAKKKGGWYQVSTELADMAGDGKITKNVMLEYIEKNPVKKAGKLKKAGQTAVDITVGDLGALGGKKNFYKSMAKQFYKELIPNINFKALSELSDLMKKAHLPAKLQEKAVSAMFYSIMSFSKEAQTALLNLIKKEGWESIAKKIIKREAQLTKAGVKLKPGEDILGRATRDVLAEAIPEYKMAYTEAPLIPLIQNGAMIGGMHTTFTLIGEYIKAKEEEQAEIEEKMNGLVTKMEKPMEFQEKWDTEAEIRGRVMKAVGIGAE